MKKTLIYILLAFFIIILALTGFLINAKKINNEAKKYNAEYEFYLNKEIFGTDVATLINKAEENNKKYNIPKDAEDNFINENKYYIEIELKMITIDKNFSGQAIKKAGLSEFIKNFNLITFKCTKIEYHKETGRVYKIILEQLEK